MGLKVSVLSQIIHQMEPDEAPDLCKLGCIRNNASELGNSRWLIGIAIYGIRLKSKSHAFPSYILSIILLITLSANSELLI